jgi:hypothetical protein
MVFIEYCWNEETKRNKRVEHKVRVESETLKKSRNLQENRSGREIYIMVLKRIYGNYGKICTATLQIVMEVTTRITIFKVHGPFRKVFLTYCNTKHHSNPKYLTQQSIVL